MLASFKIEDSVKRAIFEEKSFNRLKINFVLHDLDLNPAKVAIFQKCFYNHLKMPSSDHGSSDIRWNVLS